MASASIHHDCGRKFPHLIGTFPGIEPGRCTRPDDEKEFVAGIIPQPLERVGCVALTAAAYLEIGRIESGHAFYGQVDQSESSGSLGDPSVARLLPRIVRDHHQDPVEVQCVANIESNGDMANMRRIECASEYPCSHRSSHVVVRSLGALVRPGTPISDHSETPRDTSHKTLTGHFAADGVQYFGWTAVPHAHA